MLRVDMLNELGNDFSVRLRFKLVSLVFQKLLDVLVVGDDSCYFIFITNVNLKQKQKQKQKHENAIFDASTVVDDNELVALIRTMGMRVDLVRDSVSGPTSVRNSAVSLMNTIEIQ